MKKRLKKKLETKTTMKRKRTSVKHRFHEWLIIGTSNPKDIMTNEVDTQITCIDLICQVCGKRRTLYAFNDHMSQVYKCIENGWCFQYDYSLYFDEEEYNDICYFRSIGMYY